jgi:hypothetical protein
LVLSDRFGAAFPAHDPATFTRVSFGVRRNARIDDFGILSDLHRDQVVGDLVFDYGLPGKPGYEYSRPFDYFHFEANAASTENSLPENVSVRGLLLGSKYSLGDSYRGIWGLYGTYDYLSPEVFSVSSTALSLGTTAQTWLMHGVALQGTALGGVGWAAAGSLADSPDDRDYHYGVSPQGLLAMRFIFGDVASLDMSGREYYLIGVGSAQNAGDENILRGQVSLTVRVFGHHALGAQFVATSRAPNVAAFGDALQNVGAISVFYTYLDDKRLGVVKW